MHHQEYHAIIKAFTLTKEEKSVVKIQGEIPFETLESYKAKALTELGKDVELKGFRKGHVPEAMLIKHMGEMAVLNETANHALSDFYPHILEEYKLDAIGRPHVHITKLAPQNPFGFTLEITVMPEVILPDYKKVASGVNKKKVEASVTPQDVTDAIERIQRQKLSYDRIQEKAKKKQAMDEANKDGLTLPTPETVDKEESEEDLKNAPLPELTDAYVATLGSFTSVDDFKNKISEHITTEKKNETESKHRGTLIDALVEESTIDVPDILIQSELGQMFAQMEEDLKRASLTLDGYLEHVKKTKDDMIAEWKPTAEKRAKTQLILNTVAEKEALKPNEDEVVRQVAQIMAQYKEADPKRVRIYVESMMRNDAVMKFLEEQK